MAQLYSAGRQLIGSEVGEDCSDDRILEDMQVVAFVSLDSIRFIFDPKKYFRNRKFDHRKWNLIVRIPKDAN